MKRVVVFEAHGDDMEFLAGGTIAKFCALGHEVTLFARGGSITAVNLVPCSCGQ